VKPVFNFCEIRVGVRLDGKQMRYRQEVQSIIRREQRAMKPSRLEPMNMGSSHDLRCLVNNAFGLMTGPVEPQVAASGN
jgi:hypothetical protein